MNYARSAHLSCHDLRLGTLRVTRLSCLQKMLDTSGRDMSIRAVCGVYGTKSGLPELIRKYLNEKLSYRRLRRETQRWE